MIEIDNKILKKIYQPRPLDSHKYDFGLLLVIGGSQFYSGSPALNALAAFRAGVDMVHIIAPSRAADIIASYSPNLAAYPLGGGYLGKKDLPVLFSMAKSAEAVAGKKVAIVIGGGLGRSEETQEAIVEFLTNINIPTVIDADAIYAAARNPEIIKNKNFLFTPHSYEFFILTQNNINGKSEQEKIELVKNEANKLKTTILLKGKTDIISNGNKVAINKTGNPYLTVGGTGDTLAGIAGAIIARGIDVFEAGCAAAYINGLAGDLAAKKQGESLTATDLIEEISEVIKKVSNKD